MRLVVLGSGAGGGIPQWNSNAEACRRARAGDAGVPVRTQSSVAVSADGDDWFLLNASPDLRQQIIQTPVLHPRAGFRDSPIAGVVITNGDIDHVAGLLTLREGHAFTIRASQRVLDVLDSNSVFNVLKPGLVHRTSFALEAPFELTDAAGRGAGLIVTPFAVPGKVALYLENEAAGDDFGTVAEDTVGLEIADGRGARAFYVPACARMTDALRRRFANASLVLFDGTLWDDDELVRQGGMQKTGARMGHMSMSGPDGSIAAFEDLGVQRRVFIHINNTNPVLLPESLEREKVGEAGWELAADGMEIEL